MNSRIITDEGTGQNLDEHLEICFNQVFDHETEGEEGEAIERMLGEYTTLIFAKDAVPSDNIITDLESAIKWALQFGELRVHALSPEFIKDLLAEYDVYPQNIAFGAKIGPDDVNQRCVCGSTVHQVVLLAGIQVLRETACDVLNVSAEEMTH